MFSIVFKPHQIHLRLCLRFDCQNSEGSFLVFLQPGPYFLYQLYSVQKTQKTLFYHLQENTALQYSLITDNLHYFGHPASFSGTVCAEDPELTQAKHIQRSQQSRLGKAREVKRDKQPVKFSVFHSWKKGCKDTDSIPDSQAPFSNSCTWNIIVQE